MKASSVCEKDMKGKECRIINHYLLIFTYYLLLKRKSRKFKFKLTSDDEQNGGDAKKKRDV